MINIAYVVLQEEADFTKYIEVTLDIHSSGVMIGRVTKFCQQPSYGSLNKCY